MARTLSDIYAEAKNARDERLELTEFKNDSKMSVLDAFTWVTSACIWSFENLLDVFQVDLARDLKNRINGTPAYFANMLTKYQSGDDLIVNDEGTKFGYATVDENKRIVTKAAYSEGTEEGFNDKLLVLKVATGEAGSYAQIDYDELIKVRAYLNKLLFAGQHATVVSRIGDVIIPRVTAFYDGAVSESEAYTNIENALKDYITNLDFNGVVYAQKIVDAIQKAEHITDVSISNSATDLQGIFIVQYNDDNNLIVKDGNVEQRIDRYVVPNSGYIKESTKSGAESNLQTWREAITLKLEDNV